VMKNYSFMSSKIKTQVKRNPKPILDKGLAYGILR
jgi:hypothetical protein